MTDEIDEIYDRNVAAEKLKQGTKYERLAAIIFKQLDEGGIVVHDMRLRADGKRTFHQIDISITRAGETKRLLVECRDHGPGIKISLPDVRNFNGALVQLQASGIMVTTEAFTKGAIDYADDENIRLAVLRPFRAGDWDGRIKQVQLKLIGYHRSDPPTVELQFLEPLPPQSSQLAHVSTLPVSRDGASVEAVVQRLVNSYPLEEGPADMREEFQPPLVVQFDGVDYRLSAVVAHVTVTRSETTSVVVANALPELLLQSLDGVLDQVITEKQLQRFSFGPAGVVERRGVSNP